MTWDFIKVLLPITLTFFIGILITPIVTHFLYKYKLWKKSAGKIDTQGNSTPIFNQLNQDKEVGTPRMGGLVIWISVLITVVLFMILSVFLPETVFNKLDFLSRNQTWIPIVCLIIGALVGLIDDIMEIVGSRKSVTGGLSFKTRLSIVTLIAIFVSYWFYSKLGVTAIGLPFTEIDWNVGWLLIPIFAILMIVVYTGGVIDGIDGLSGGVFSIMFSAYGIIAFSMGQINLAALCGAIVGGILAFLWFNIPPARFYMTETGSMALTITLVVVALMTDKIVEGVGLFVLPVISLPLIVSGVSSVAQIASKKFRNGKKILRAAPLHLHLQAIGWPSYKVTMRYWVITTILAFIGIMIALIS
jgi:phospho-N-acetylmuramoyl-pentapeptide-transferase